jgi:hypothetical protein
MVMVKARWGMEAEKISLPDATLVEWIRTTPGRSCSGAVADGRLRRRSWAVWALGRILVYLQQYV